MKCLVTLCTILILIGCKKSIDREHSAISYQNRSIEHPSFPDSLEISSHNNFINDYYENAGIDSGFATSIFRDSVFVSGIIGFINEDSRILNIVTIPTYFEEELQTVVDIFYIDGEHIGSYTVEDSKVIDTQIFGDIEMEETPADQARGWWGCTKECIKDAMFACNSDPECFTMLLIANLGTALVTRTKSFVGNASIAVACGSVCVKDRNLDLLPNH